MTICHRRTLAGSLAIATFLSLSMSSCDDSHVVLEGSPGAELQLRPPLIPERYTCRDCSIQTSHLLDFGQGEYGPHRLARVARDGGGRYWVSQTYVEGTIAVYDSAGGLITTVGRKGHGPGENEFIWALAAADSGMYVYDRGNKRLNFFGPDLQLAGSVPMKFALEQLFTMPDRRLLAAFDNPFGPTPASIHFLTDSGRYISAVAPAKFYNDDIQQMLRGVKVVAPTDQGGVVIGDAAAYKLSLMSGGRVVREFGSDVDWFDSYSLPRDKQGVLARMIHMRVDSLNHAWVMFAIPQEGYVEPKNLQRDSQGMVPIAEVSKYYDCALEVWDLNTGTLVTGVLFDTLLSGFAADNQVYGFFEDEEGELRIRLWRVGLDNRN